MASLDNLGVAAVVVVYLFLLLLLLLLRRWLNKLWPLARAYSSERQLFFISYVHTYIHKYNIFGAATAAHLHLPSPFHKHIHIYYFFYGCPQAEIAIYARAGCHISQQPNIILHVYNAAHAHIFAMLCDICSAHIALCSALLCIQLVNWQRQLG